MWVAKIRIFRESDLWVPAMQMHHDTCKKHKGCCSFKYEYCYHLASKDFAEAEIKAKKLAKNIGVSCG